MRYVQGSAKGLRPGLVYFVPAVAYHFCLSLPAAFSQPGNGTLAHPCTCRESTFIIEFPLCQPGEGRERRGRVQVKGREGRSPAQQREVQVLGNWEHQLRIRNSRSGQL